VYYVVPVRTGNDVTLAVWYYQQVASSMWARVYAKDLDSGGAAAVTLQQPTPDQIVECTNLRHEDIDPTVQLFVAVARNLGVEDPHQNSYSAVDGAVTIDVGSGSTRALILVFTKAKLWTGQASDAADVGQLMSTTEPEIKNGVGAGDGARA
jgi:hypothetical protein